jgi:thioredoxin-related protein
LYTHFYNLTGCGLDSVDVVLLAEGSLLPDLVSKILQDRHPAQPVTMNDILQSYKAFSNQKEFQEMKGQLAKILTLVNPKVTRENWPATKAALLELEEFRFDLNRAEQHLSFAIENELSYKQFFEELDNWEPMLETPADKKPWAYQNIPYDEAIALARSADKPLILFFTGHAVVNAVKMDDYVLNNEEVRQVLDEHFVFVPLYVDDRTPVEEEKFRNLGQKNLAFQKEKFQTERQPFLVLMDVDGNVLRTFGYTSKVDDFMAFLKKSVDD